MFFLALNCGGVSSWFIRLGFFVGGGVVVAFNKFFSKIPGILALCA